MKHGLLWLARSLQLAASARAEGSDRAIRINVAEWEDRLCRPRASLRLPSPIAELAFSPDGRSLVAVGSDAVVRIIDASATGGHPMAAAALPTAHAARRIALLPRGAGLLATADDGRVSFWDPNGWRTTGHPLVHPPGRAIRGMVASPDGRRLVTACDDGSIRCWDASTGDRIGEVLAGAPGTGDRALALTPDGRMLIVGGEDGLALRWDLATGRRIDPPLRHDAAISAIACGRDGRSIVVGTRDGRLHVWDSAGTRVSEPPARGAAVTGLAVSPDGETFAAATAGGVVRLWDFHMPGHPVQTVMLGGAVTRVAFHPGGGALATGQDDGTIQLWASSRSPAIGRPIRVGRPVESMSFRDGSRLLVVTGGEARAWDIDRDGAGPPAGRERSPSEVTALAPDGKTLATVQRAAAGGRQLVLRDAATGCILPGCAEQHEPILGVAFSSDSRWLLTWGDRPGDARLCDVATLREARPMFKALDAPLHRAIFRADGGTILVGCRDGTARLWDIETDEEINPGLRPHHDYPITALAAPRAASGWSPAAMTARSGCGTFPPGSSSLRCGAGPARSPPWPSAPMGVRS